jgi:DNA (cytosine-5)-methyltransferase 1
MIVLFCLVKITLRVRRRMGPHVLDLFCGAGGFAAGFREAGFDILGAIDQSYTAFLTYHHNFPNALFLNKDLHELHSIDILDKLGVTPDVIIASPPCEPYTAANMHRQKQPLDRLYEDVVGQLVLDAIRIIGDIHPKFFVVENVPELLSGEIEWALEREFHRVGYPEVYFNLLFAEDYGTPSRRKRLFISNLLLQPVRQPSSAPVHEILTLPDPTAIHDIPNHTWYPISPKKQRKLRKTRRGNALVFYQSATQKTYTNWVRLAPNGLAPTVIGHSRFIHPFEDRVLTVRENARLMGFPDNFSFFGGLDDQYDQVGEAVPVPLATAIARFCINELKRVLEKNPYLL